VPIINQQVPIISANNQSAEDHGRCLDLSSATDLIILALK